MAKAMVIDDSRSMRLILTRSLNKLGFEVCPAGNGKEALHILAQEHPDLALFLVDWNMPEVNGLEFVQRVRAIPSYAGTPLMMVTTETEVQQMIKALEAGANEYVMKPFTEEVIADKLRIIGALQ